MNGPTAAAGRAPGISRFLLPLLLLSAAAYYPALNAGYLNWDDQIHTAENPLVKDFSLPALRQVFTAPRHANYHPLTDLSLGAEARLFGKSAGVHHAGNILLHAANACLVFLLIAGVTGGRTGAFWGALLWALHPAQAESVCWIAERKNLLYAFFFLSALLAYLRHAARPSAASLAAVTALFLASLLSKASAVTLPLLLPLADMHLKRPFTRGSYAEKLFFILLAGVFTAVSAAAQGQTGGGIITGNPLTLLSFYLLNVVWPSGLSGLYPYAETSLRISAHLLRYTLPALVFGAAVWYAVRRNRQAAFGLFFFILNLLPFLLLIPVGPSLAADRYLYVPLAGLALAAAALTGRLVSVSGRRTATGIFLAANLTALLLLLATVRRAAIWENSRSFWSSVISVYPGNATALLNLADANLEEKRTAEAEAVLLRLLDREPENWKALYNLGTLYGMARRYMEAEALLKRSLLLRPGHAPAWSNLGKAQLAQGRPDEARKALLTAISADAGYAAAYASLSEAEAALGRKEEAEAYRLRHLELTGNR